MDFKNSEGYPDPTCYEALRNIEAEERRSPGAFRPIVYICSPYAGDVERNVKAARRYCRFVTDTPRLHRIFWSPSALTTRMRRNARSVCSSGTP